MKADKRLQHTGGGTPYVYLPKEWTDELFPDDRIVMQRLPLGVFLVPPSPAGTKALYNIKTDSVHLVKEAILSAYTQGHREVHVRFPPMNPRGSSEVSLFASRLIGVVAKVESGEVVMKEYADQERVDLGLLVEALFGKCKEMASASADLLESMANKEREPLEVAKAVEQIEDEADFLSFGLFRLLSSRSRYVENPGEELVHLLFYAVINYAAERYCDALYGMTEACRQLLELSEPKEGAQKATLDALALIPHASVGLIERATGVVLLRDGTNANDLRGEIRRLRHDAWEPAVARVLASMVSPLGRNAALYAVTQVGSRLLESGTYLESFCSRTSQFYFANPSPFVPG